MLIGAVLGLGCGAVRAWTQPQSARRQAAPQSDPRLALLSKFDREELHRVFGDQLSLLRRRAAVRQVMLEQRALGVDPQPETLAPLKVTSSAAPAEAAPDEVAPTLVVGAAAAPRKASVQQVEVPRIETPAYPLPAAEAPRNSAQPGVGTERRSAPRFVRRALKKRLRL